MSIFPLIFYFVLLIFPCASEEENSLFDLTNFRGEPSAIVGQVNVITGAFIDYEKDTVLPGHNPFVLDRVYASSSSECSNLGFGWNFRYNHAAYWTEETKKHYEPGHHYFTVGDGMGSRIQYRSLHKNGSCVGKYRIDEKLWKRGLTNLSAEGVSGKTNLNNEEARLDMSSGKLRYGNGDVLFFRSTDRVKNPYTFQDSRISFLPTHKNKLNRLKETYSFKKDFYLTDVEFYGSLEKKLGYFHFKHKTEGGKKTVKVNTSTGKPIEYFYKQYKDDPHLTLNKVVRPHAPTIKYEYTIILNVDDFNHTNNWSHVFERPHLSRKEFPDNRFTHVKYYEDKNSKKESRVLGKVQKTLKPLGEGDFAFKEYEFIYHRHQHSRQELEQEYLFKGHTEVFDALGFKKSYAFEKNRLLSIDTYKGLKTWTGIGEFEKYRTEKFLWSDGKKGCPEGYFLGKMIEDTKGVFQLGSFVKYDSFGNITKEKLKGNLTGRMENGSFDVYIKEMVYSQDKKNLLLEEWDTQKKVIYRYVEETNLLAARFLTDHHTICKREFFFYDENGFTVKEITDDGTSKNEEDLTSVSERKIIEYKPCTTYPFTLPQEIIYKAYDISQGVEKQIKKVKNSYTIEGWLQQMDVFDADDHYSYSKKYVYNSFGKVVYEEDGTGAVIEYAYDANLNKIEERGPIPGFRKIFTYDLCNRLLKEEEILEEKISLIKNYRYNFKNECIEETDISGNATRFTYDELGRKIGIELPLFFSEEGFTSLKTTLDYDLLDNPCIKIDERGNATKTSFTGRGKPYTIEHPDGTKEWMYYGVEGSLQETIDKYGNKTTLENDYQGRPLSKKITSSSGEVLKQWRFEYSTFHCTKEIDPLGSETLYAYDFAGRLCRKTRGSSIEEYAYDSLSRLAKTVTWTSRNDAVVTLQRYDNKDRVIEVSVESLSGVIQSRKRYEYNAVNKKTEERELTLNGEAVTRYVYNTHGDLIETINPLGVSTKIEYNYSYLDGRGERGVRIISIDPKGVRTVVDKNSLGLEKRIEKINSLGETLQLYDFLYNSKGEKSKRVEVVYRSGKPERHVITEWTWDAFGRLETVTEAFSSKEAKTTRVAYNSLGQRETILKPSGLQIHFSYDNLGRMSRWYASDGSFDYTYSYDALDNPILTEDHLYGTRTKKTYDIQGRLVEEEQGNGLAVKYSYDLGGRVNRFTYPDGSSITYDYLGSHLSLIKRFTPQNNEAYHFDALEHDYRGKLKQGKLPLNAGTYEITRDIMGRTTTIQGPHWEERITGYDSAGNLLTRTLNDPKGILNEYFAYDSLNQLIEERGAASHNYTFDSLYNRVREDDTENSFNDLNQVLERKDRSYRYDADGNLIELNKPGKTLRFGYDATGRMTSFTDGTTHAAYRYDETNRRITKIVNDAETTRYIYKGQCELGTYDQGGEVRILGGIGLGAEIGDAIAIEKKDAVLIPLHDHNGNLMALIDAKTSLPLFHTRYSAFGKEITPQGEGVSWGFSSKRKDPESGFIFFGRRFYDPESGRFLTKDPLGDRDGPNLYAYVSNNPLMFFDLWGLLAETQERRADEIEFAPIRWIKAGLDFAGRCIENFSREFLPPGPFQYAGEGIGRVLQGKTFSHKDNFAFPIGHDRVGTRTLEGATVHATLGIETQDSNNFTFANQISELLDNIYVKLLSHRSTGFHGDIFNCFHLVCGMQTQTSISMAVNIINDYYELIDAGFSEPLIAYYVHSRGGLEMHRALELLPAEIKSCLAVYTFGSPVPIKPDGLYDAVNYVNPNDIVPKLGSFVFSKEGAKIINTNYRTDSALNFINDHGIDTPGYQGAMRDACTDFIRKLEKIK